MTKRATILDVAKACGLSQATVARVLNSQTDIQVKENTRKKVLLAAENIGYKRNIIAANFRQQKTKNIAISIADITNPFFPELIKGIQTKMREHGYSIVQLNNEWDPEIEQENFNYMMQTRVDGNSTLERINSHLSFKLFEPGLFWLLSEIFLYFLFQDRQIFLIFRLFFRLSEITYPSLTTVEKNRSKIGSLAAESLIQKINNPFKWQTKKVILPCKLIERNSTGPI